MRPTSKVRCTRLLRNVLAAACVLTALVRALMRRLHRPSEKHAGHHRRGAREEERRMIVYVCVAQGRHSPSVALAAAPSPAHSLSRLCKARICVVENTRVTDYSVNRHTPAPRSTRYDFHFHFSQQVATQGDYCLVEAVLTAATARLKLHAKASAFALFQREIINEIQCFYASTCSAMFCAPSSPDPISTCLCCGSC